MEFRISPQISGKIAWHSFKLNVAENEVSVSLEAWQARRLPSDGSPALVSISQKVQLSGGGNIYHCLTRSDVTSVERGVRMSQCGQAPLGMRIEGDGDSHFS